MKNILLLSDLSLGSLWPVHTLVKEQTARPINLYVVHMLHMPASISDLLSLKSNKPYASVSARFTEALQLLKNKYSGQLQTVSFRFLYGNNSRILNNFIEGAGIDCTYVTATNRTEKPFESSVDFVPLLKRCSVPVKKTPLQKGAEAGHQSLSVLLDDETSVRTAALRRPSFSYS